jgi:hypothetical protein
MQCYRDNIYEEEYVTINLSSGEIRTGKDKIDFENIQKISYTVNASDGENSALMRVSWMCHRINFPRNIRTLYTTLKSMYVYVCLCICRGGFPHALRPYVVYCTSSIDIQTAAMRTHRASPLVPPTREQRN